MIKIKLNEILEEQERNMNWLAQKTGITYSCLYNLVNYKTSSVNFSTLNKLCNFLKCNVNDIFEYVED